MASVSNALVIGGGIGGLTAAVSLRRAGIAVDVVELDPEWSVYGVGILQPSNMLRALDKLGLAETCVRLGTGFPGWLSFDEAGKGLFELRSANDAAPQYPAINGITRPLFQKVLVEAAVEAGAQLFRGVTFTRFRERDDEVTVEFTDGRTKSYELVIGCDGTYSDVRREVFGAAHKPEFVGQAVWRYNLPRPPDMAWAQIYWGAKSKTGLVPLSPTLMYMLLVTEEPGNPRVPRERMADLMRQRLSGYTAPLIRELRDQITDPHAVVYKPIECLLMPPPWYKGRILLIGDAAHAFTPHNNQGAAMAIEDAVILGELLAGDDPLAGVLDAFMKRRFARVKRVADGSLQISAWELEEWAGTPNPLARPMELMGEISREMAKDF